MASSSTTRHGATANRRRTPTGATRRASSARNPARPARPTRAKASESSSLRHSLRIPTRRLFTLFVLAAIALTVWSFYPVARVQYIEEREHARLQAELESLQARNARLSKRVARLRTPEGVEDEARETLGLVKEGETQGLVIDPSADPKASTASEIPEVDTEEPVSAPKGPWTPVLDLVFGVHE